MLWRWAGKPTRKDESTVYIVDDDQSVRRALRRVVCAQGLHAETFASATDFLGRHQDNGRPGCLVLDVCMPGLNGLELQARLQQEDSLLPIVFISGRGDIPMSVQAMKAGAISFLTKPFTEDDLMSACRV